MAGDELLIVEGNDAHREGMRKLFDDDGYVCTATSSIAHALELASRKFFPVVLVDLDIEQPGAGLDLLRGLRERSAVSAVIMLCGRRSFELAVDAFRLGALDVVVKRPDQIARLKESVGVACDRARAKSDGSLLKEVRSSLDEAFQVMLEMARKLYVDATPSGEAHKPAVLLVESDQDFLKKLAPLVAKKGWDLVAEMNGGAALDRASARRFDIVVCRDELPDLRGTTVVKSIQGTAHETSCLVYTSPGPEGQIIRYQGGQGSTLDRSFAGPTQLVAQIDALVRELETTARDRKVIRAFRADRADYLRRYAELKQRIDRLVD